MNFPREWLVGPGPWNGSLDLHLELDRLYAWAVQVALDEDRIYLTRLLSMGIPARSAKDADEFVRDAEALASKRREVCLRLGLVTLRFPEEGEYKIEWKVHQLGKEGRDEYISLLKNIFSHKTEYLELNHACDLCNQARKNLAALRLRAEIKEKSDRDRRIARRAKP